MSKESQKQSITPTVAPGVAIERCHNAMRLLGYTHPHILLWYAHVKDNCVEISDNTTVGNRTLSTMAVSNSGRIYINPRFVMSLTKEELMGVLSHEVLHIILQHFNRLNARDPKLWNIATDCCINTALKNDGIQLPNLALYPPQEYTGDLYAEELYEWFQQHPDKCPKVSDDPDPTGGCSQFDDGEPTDKNWKEIAQGARSMAQQVGNNTQGINRLLAPRESKINWRDVIRAGFQQVASVPGRDFQTWSRKNRRSPSSGPQFPGWIGAHPRIAISIDVSGSMSPKMLESIMSEIKMLLQQYPNVRCYANAHTSDVVWSDHITKGSSAKLNEAFAFSGGTDPAPAYADIKRQGEFDCLVHMTDTVFDKWPEVPAKRLIVGAFTRQVHCDPPVGSKVILCDVDG